MVKQREICCKTLLHNPVERPVRIERTFSHVIIWHIGPRPSILPTILNSARKLPALFAEHDAPIEKGHIYVAPPDHHMVLTAEYMRLSV